MLLDWSQCSAVERDPEKQGGALVFKGTRTPVSVVFASLGEGGLDALVEEYGLEDEREQVEEVLEFLEKSCEAPARTA
jgi:uncharacterized protein (DUF433 family)